MLEEAEKSFAILRPENSSCDYGPQIPEKTGDSRQNTPPIPRISRSIRIAVIIGPEDSAKRVFVF
jgi:hypothetical protein